MCPMGWSFLSRYGRDTESRWKEGGMGLVLLSKRREIWMDRSSSGVTYPLAEPLVKTSPSSRKLGTHQRSGKICWHPIPNLEAMQCCHQCQCPKRNWMYENRGGAVSRAQRLRRLISSSGWAREPHSCCPWPQCSHWGPSTLGIPHSSRQHCKVFVLGSKAVWSC